MRTACIAFLSAYDEFRRRLPGNGSCAFHSAELRCVCYLIVSLCDISHKLVSKACFKTFLQPLVKRDKRCDYFSFYGTLLMSKKPILSMFRGFFAQKRGKNRKIKLEIMPLEVMEHYKRLLLQKRLVTFENTLIFAARF